MAVTAIKLTDSEIADNLLRPVIIVARDAK